MQDISLPDEVQVYSREQTKEAFEMLGKAIAMDIAQGNYGKPGTEDIKWLNSAPSTPEELAMTMFYQLDSLGIRLCCKIKDANPEELLQAALARMS